MDDWFGLQRGLVAVGLLAVVPGCTEDKDKATESTGTDPGSTSATDGTGTTGTSGDTPTGTGSGSATDSGTSTTGEPTTGGTSTTDATTGTSTSTTGGIDIPPVCQSYGAKVAECYNPRYGMEAAAGCAYGIQQYGMTYGPDCAKALEDFYACLSALSCAELTGPGPVCDAESMNLDPACQ